MALSGPQNHETSSNEASEVEVQVAKSEGSYIEERKRNVEYLDLETEDGLNVKRKQENQQSTLITTAKLPASNVSADPPPVDVAEDDAPPGEEEFEDQSFSNQYSELYSNDANTSSSHLKRSIDEANLNAPENQYLTLDEIEERKSARVQRTLPSKSSNAMR